MRVTIRTPASEGGRRSRTALGRRVTLAAALRLARNHTDRFSLEDSDTMAASALASSLTAVAAVRGRRVDAPRARRAASHRALAVSPRAMGPEMGRHRQVRREQQDRGVHEGQQGRPGAGSATPWSRSSSPWMPSRRWTSWRTRASRGMKVYSTGPLPQVHRRRVLRRVRHLRDTYKDGSLKETVDVAMMS